MRKQIALTLCAGAIAVAVFLRLRDIESWFWATQLIATTWLFTGIWFGKVSLSRTHRQMAKDEVKSVAKPRLAWIMIWGGCWLNVLAIALHFALD
jgi:hypothetical protein